MHYTSRAVYEYVSQHTNDPIIQWKICTVSGTEFPITQSDLDFYNKISPTFGDQKFPIPTPTLCPEERQRRRLSFRNERKLYKRKCDLTGKDIISIYSPDKPYKVYDQSVRRWDSRDPMSYGREFDFSKSFTEQFKQLIIQTPHSSMITTWCEQCDYACFILDSKECYMFSGITQSEKVMYSNFIKWCDSIIDSSMTYESSYLYQCVDCFKIYNCFFSTQLVNCSSCYLCNDCQNCTHCIACFWLQNKEYFYQNKFIWKERFLEIIQSVWKNSTLQEAKNILIFNSRDNILHNNNLSSSNVYWNNIIESQNSTFCFDIRDSEKSKYLGFTPHARSSQDCTYTAPRGVEYCYDVCSTVGVNWSAFTFLYRYGVWSYYLLYCQNCDNCFWCIWLRNKSYCIFNKQYTKEEYEIQVAKIISHMQSTGEWWEFFHPSLSPFGYNETVAQEYFPLVRGELESVWYHRSDYSSDPVIPVGAVLIHRREYDDNQWKALRDDPQHSILKSIVICEVSGRPFVIQWAELKFYLQHDIALPSKHPDVRHEERMKLRPGRTLFLRSCNQCSSEMLSVYDDDHSGKVYCESCYQKEIYG